MLHKRRNEVSSQLRTGAGFTLVELMIALILGLLVVAGVGSVFLANQTAYRSNVALGEMQDSARTSFEFLAREIRAAGANPCGTANVESVLKASGDQMLDVYTPIEGWDDPAEAPDLDGNGVGQPVAGNAIRLASARNSGLSLESTTVLRTTVELANSTTQISNESIAMICDVDKATIFQVTSDPSAKPTLEHTSGGADPGNRTECLNHPVPVTKAQGGAASECNSFSPSSYLAIPTNYIWYVGGNNVGGRSLYRYGRGQNANSAPAEMVRGVWDMTVSYHEQGSGGYVAAGSVSNWANVDAVRLALTVRSGGGQAAALGTDSQPLERVFTSTVALRNRLNNN